MGGCTSKKIEQPQPQPPPGNENLLASRPKIGLLKVVLIGDSRYTHLFFIDLFERFFFHNQYWNIRILFFFHLFCLFHSNHFLKKVLEKRVFWNSKCSQCCFSLVDLLYLWADILPNNLLHFIRLQLVTNLSWDFFSFILYFIKTKGADFCTKEILIDNRAVTLRIW